MKPSSLIDEALIALELVEQQPNIYIVSMESWHKPGLDRCYVCLAGAYFAVTQQLNPKSRWNPYSIDSKSDAAYGRALDRFRIGWIEGGLSELGISLPQELPIRIDIIRYDDNPLLFKSGLKTLATKLKEFNL